MNEENSLFSCLFQVDNERNPRCPRTCPPRQTLPPIPPASLPTPWPPIDQMLLHPTTWPHPVPISLKTKRNGAQAGHPAVPVKTSNNSVSTTFPNIPVHRSSRPAVTLSKSTTKMVPHRKRPKPILKRGRRRSTQRLAQRCPLRPKH